MAERIVIAYPGNPPQSARISSRSVTRSRHTRRSESVPSKALSASGGKAGMRIGRRKARATCRARTRRPPGAALASAGGPIPQACNAIRIQEGDGHRWVDRTFQGRLRRGDQGPSGRCMPHTIVDAYLVPEPIKIVHTTGAHDPAAGGVPALPSDLHGRPSVSCRHAAGLVRLLCRRGKATSSSSKPPASTARAGST